MSKILNLVYSDKSDIKYKISKFPDGQQQITLEYKHPDPWLNNPITIKSRFNNFQDLELIVCAVADLREFGVSRIHLFVPYILGARSDRKFETGSNNYLKMVICPLLNSLNLDSITVLDPHSHCLEMGLNNFRSITNEELVKDAFSQIGDFDSRDIDDGSILVSPDAGASHKIYKLAQSIDYTGEIITCSKERDEKGKLTKCIVPLNINKVNKNFIIIDDICDGGATFINIAKTIKEKREFSSAVHPSNYGKIYLIVTHGIFSKGFSELSRYFDGIYCTNSYSDLSAISFESTDKGNHKVKVEDFVKQLNAF